MADLTELQSSDTVKIVGSDASGVEQTPVQSSANGDLRTADSINNSGINGAISCTNSATEAKVGAARLANRKMLSLCPTNGTIYWGFTSSVTVATGTPIFKNQIQTFSFTDNVPVYIVSAAAVDVRVAEAK